MIYPHPQTGSRPKVDDSVFLAPSSDVIGDVEIGRDSSVWFQVVIRGDVNWIRIGEETNIQDHSMLHVTRKKYPLSVGSQVTVGHRVMLHGCTVGDRVLIGMSATVMDGAKIGSDSVVGAGSLVTQGKEFPAGHLIVGSPARTVRELTDEEKSYLVQSAANYVDDARGYLKSHEN